MEINLVEDFIMLSSFALIILEFFNWYLTLLLHGVATMVEVLNFLIYQVL